MRYFTLDEFDSPDLPGSGELMDTIFVELLDKARAYAGIPFYITSGYRTKEHNLNVGGVSNSAHRYGLACDITCLDSVERFKIIEALLYVGFNRIGIHQSFIHVDLSSSKAQFVCWTY